MPGTGELLYSILGYYRMVYYNEIYACSAHFGCSENYQGILWMLELEPHFCWFVVAHVHTQVKYINMVWTILSSATSLHDNPGQEEAKSAPPFVEEVHQGVHFDFSHVSEGVLQMMLPLGQIRDTLQVCWSWLLAMTHSARGKSVNSPKYPLAIHQMIVLRRHCNHWCLPTQMSKMIATICKSFILQQRLVKCIFPHPSSVLHAHPHIIQSQQGVHAPSV